MSVTRSNPAQIQGYTTAYSQTPKFISNSWKQISYGDNHVLGLKQNNTLWAWGLNDNGQLGLGDNISRSSPVQIGSDTWSVISAGTSSSSGIKSNGLMYTWGINTSGQLGLTSVNATGDTISRSSPTQVGSSSWTSVSAGSNHMSAIRSDSTLWAWGGNESGQAGQSDYFSRSSPVQVTSLSYTQVEAGTNYTLALTTNYTVVSFGNNIYGQLGATAYTEVKSWSVVAGNDDFTLAIRQDGTLWAWGLNTTGQLGLNDRNYRSSPVQVGGSSWSFVSVNGGVTGASVSAIRIDGTLWSWGLGTSGLLGNGLVANRSSPVQVSGGGSWTTVSAGQSHKLAIKSDGGLYAWGLNSSGQLGQSDSINRSLPTQIGIDSWTKISAGGITSYAIKNDSTLWTWGGNTNGTLGDSTTVNKSSISQIGTSSWTNVFGSNTWAHGITIDGRLHGWGLGTTGQLGYNDSISRSSPVQISSSKFTQVAGYATTSINTIALDTYGNIWAWGAKSTKLLSEVNNTNFTYSWTTISTGLSHNVAVRNDGRLYTWGLNGVGQLGDGTTTNKSSPTVLGATGGIGEFWLTATAGGNRTYAVRNDYTLWGWGDNSFYGLGLITDSINRSSPVQISTSSWTLVAAGVSHAMATNINNKLYTWGYNAQGQLGTSDSFNRSSPTQVSSSISFTQISAGGSHSVAIDSTSKIYTWGSNDLGQLGTNDSINRSAPTQIGSSSYILVSAGDKHTMVIDANNRLLGFGNNQSYQVGVTTLTNILQLNNLNIGFIKSNDYSLWLWGSNDVGQLGINNTLNRSSPVQIDTAQSYTILARAPTATAGHTLAIRGDGSLWSWGQNNAGQLGLSVTTLRSSPTQVSTSSWLQVAAGISHSLAIKSDGTLWGWGLNTSGQAGMLSWTQISSGNSHTLVLRSDGQLFGYGLNSSGQLGQSDTINRSSPTQVGVGNIFTKIAAGQNISAAIRSDGGLFTWGSNTNGALGDGTTVNKSSPSQIGTSSWTQVSANDYMLALLSNNTLYAWGNNNTYQLGLGDTTLRSSPVLVAAGTSFNLISAGSGHALATTNNNKLWSWGSNTAGQLGLSDFINQSWTNVYVGGDTSITVRQDGSLWSVGYNIYGQLGNGTTQSRSSPVQIGTGNDWKFGIVSLSGSHSLSIKNNNTLWAWGYNGYGQIGDGTTENRSSPVQIAGSWTLAIPGVRTSYGIKTDGTLWAWGWNSTDYSYGITSTQSRSSPVQIGTVGTQSWTQITAHGGAGVGNIIGIQSDGTLWGWGYNGFTTSTLQTGDTVYRSLPVQLGSDTDWKYVTTHSNNNNGYNYVYGLKNNGTLYGWGENLYGQLAQGDTIDRSSPVQIGVGQSYLAVYTTLVNLNTGFFAQRSDGTLWTGGALGFDNLDVSFSSYFSSPVQVGTSYSFVLASSFANYNAMRPLGVWPLLGRTNATLLTWGTDNQGKLGDNTVTSHTSPILITNSVLGYYAYQVSASSWTSISAGNSHSLAIRSDGGLFVWGSNNSQQLGLGYNDYYNRSSPTQVGTSSWTSVYAGNNYSIAKAIDSTLYAWGSNLYGQLGFTQALSWTVIGAPLAINSNSILYAVGSNANGELGDSTSISRSSPIQVGTSSWSYVASTDNTRFGITTINTLYAWGLNTTGQLGLSNTITRSSPTQIAGSWSVIAASGTGHSLGIKSDGTLWAWGVNTYGELGVQDTIVNINRSSPTQVGSTVWRSVAAGNNFSLAIDTDYKLYVWGRNDVGQLGTSVPYSWTVISNGGSHSVAIRNDGKLFAWGLNNAGQLGLGTDTINRSSPVQVGTNSWTSVTAGLSHTAGATTDGTYWTWGLNSSGQLGLTTDTISRSSPTQIGTVYNGIFAGGNNTFATKDNSSSGSFPGRVTLFAFGSNNNGQLGLSDTINRSSPTQVGTSYRTVSIGNSGHVIATQYDYTLWAWGLNSSGQLGMDNINSKITRSSPIQVGTATAQAGSLVSTYLPGIAKGITIAFTAGTDDVGTGDFCLEAYIYYLNTGKQEIFNSKNSGGGVGVSIDTNGTRLVVSNTSVADLGYSNNVLTNNRWYHIAVSRIGTTITFYVNGVASGTVTGNSTNFASGTGESGASNDANPFKGYISNLRFVKGNGVYTGTFAVPTSNLAGTQSAGTNINAITAGQTLLLTYQDRYLVDRSGSSKVISIYTAMYGATFTYVGIPVATSWTSVSAGTDHSLALASDSSLWAWGGNGGQVGAFSTPSFIPTGAQPGGTGVLLSNGKLFMWGSNTLGAIGDNTAVSKSSPVVTAATQSFVMMTNTDGQSTFAIAENGSLWAWGANGAGQLGDGTTTTRSSPVLVDSTNRWISVSTGISHWMGIRSDNTLWTMGGNNNGQLGLGDTINRSAPTQVTGVSDWLSIGAGRNHSYAIRYNSGNYTLFGWGLNTNGQVGDGTVVSKSSPVQVTNSVRTVVAGGSHGVAINTDNTIWAWGANNGGQLGLNISNTVNRSSPVQIGTSSWVAVAASQSASAAIRAEGSTWCWGYSGETGISLSVSRSAPVQISAITSSYVTVWASGTTYFALTTAGTLYAWGGDSGGNTGANATVVTSRSIPVQILTTTLANTPVLSSNVPTKLGTSSWTAVAAGNSWSTAIRSDGGLFTWGAGAAGEQGSGARTSRSSPVQVGTLSWSQVSGKYNPIAVTTAYGIFTWGNNAQGQVGDLTILSRSSPVTISGSTAATGILAGMTDSIKSPTQVGTSSWASIAAGDSHAGGILSVGTLYTWGLNANGQLGGSAATGNTQNRSSPVQITTVTNWNSITAGNSFMAGITSVNTLYTWGNNTNGQLGYANTGTSLNRSAPTQISGSSWSTVSAGSSFVYAIDTSNRLFSWGSNNNGQLGLNDTINRSSPVQIGTTNTNIFYSPTPIYTYTAPTSSYSVLFNGTTDYLLTSSTSLLLFGTNDFTVEAWVFHIGAAPGGGATNDRFIFGRLGTVPNQLFFLTNGALNPAFWDGTNQRTSSSFVNPNTWTHVSVNRSGGNITFSVNGIVDSQSTSTVNFTTASAFAIGRSEFDATRYFPGYISNLRVVIGVAVYTGNFTVPTTALTATQSSGTNINAITSGQCALLTLQDNKIIDNSINNLSIILGGGSPTIYQTSNSWTTVGAGDNQTEIIRSDNTLWAFGLNNAGQLGDVSTISRNGPVQVGYATLYDTRSSPVQIDSGSWSYVTAGQDFSAGIKSDGTLYTWGINTAGYLGDGTTYLSRSFRQISGSYTWINTGGSHTVALKTDSTLWTWGLNNAGQLGQSNTLNRSSPVQVSGSYNTVLAGNSHTLALDTTNTLYGWGLNSSGQLGISTTTNRSAPTQVTSVSPGIITYSMLFNGTSQYLLVSSNSSFAFKSSDFTVEFWFNGASQVNKTFYDYRSSTATNNPYITTDTSSGNYLRWGNTNLVGSIPIANSKWNHCAITRQSGTIKLWVNGILDNSGSDTTNYFVTGDLRIGGNYSSGGYLSGYLSNYRVVVGTAVYTSNFNTPTTNLINITNTSLLLNSSTIVDSSANNVSVTNIASATVDSSTSPFLYYSGYFNGSSYISTNTTTDLTIGTNDFTIEAWIYPTAMSSNGYFVLMSQGTASAVTNNWMFGLSDSTNRYVHFDTNQTTYNYDSTVSVSLNQWTHIAAVRISNTLKFYVNGFDTGSSFTVSTNLNDTGDTRIGRGRSSANYASGYITNVRVVIGTGVYTGNFTPSSGVLRSKQPSNINVSSLSGTETRLLTLQNSTLVDNSSYGFTLTNSGTSLVTTYTPFNQGSSSIFDFIVAGPLSSYGVKSNYLYVWGSNTAGALGDNTTVNKSVPTSLGILYTTLPSYSSPVQIGAYTGNGFNNVSAGNSNTSAIATDYTIWVWGNNSYYQLGDSTTISKSSPTQITANTLSFAQLSVGYSHTAGLTNKTNLIYMWGLNNTGQLGQADVINRSSPVQVFAGTMTSPLIPLKLDTIKLSSYTMIQNGQAASAIKSDGTLWTWGTGTTGQLGVNIISSRSSPVSIGGSLQSYNASPTQMGTSSWTQISAGYSHVLATDTNYNVFGWGTTPGNGLSSNKSQPTQITAGTSYISISAGSDVSSMIDNLYNLYVWGTNTNYKTGLYNLTSSQSTYTPQVIGQSTSWTNVGGNGGGAEINVPSTTPIYTSGNVNYLVVAGGGGGGSSKSNNGGGGAGAGGYLSGAFYASTGVVYTISVGSGGVGSNSATNSLGTQGGNSSLTGTGVSITSYGGGYGGSDTDVVGNIGYGGNGGSGGGADGTATTNVGRGVYPGSTYISGPRQGYDGGVGGTGGGGAQGAGGGGGAGGVGADRSGGTSGAGGSGLVYTDGNYYAGGGGGGASNLGSSTGANGGNGGGGKGGDANNIGSVVSGTANTGGGGGGAGQNYTTNTNYGGSGGSGIVIIKFTTGSVTVASTTGSPTVTLIGSYTYYYFNNSGTITFN